MTAHGGTSGNLLRFYAIWGLESILLAEIFNSLLGRRSLTGHDVEAIRTKYGVAAGRDVKIRRFNDATGTWGTATVMATGLAGQPPAAAIGRVTDPGTGASAGALAVVFAAAGSGYQDQIGFLTHSFSDLASGYGSGSALDACASLAHDTSNCESFRAPAVAASSTQGAGWVAAWTAKRRDTSTSCAGGIIVKGSRDGFRTIDADRETTIDFCTLEPPALAYDEVGHQFVLTALSQSGEINVFLSNDSGATWGAAIPLGLHSLAAPAVACSLSQFAAPLLGSCILVYADGDRHYLGGGDYGYVPHLQNAPLYILPNWSPLSSVTTSTAFAETGGFPNPLNHADSEAGIPFAAEQQIVETFSPTVAAHRLAFGNAYSIGSSHESTNESESMGVSYLGSLYSRLPGLEPPIEGFADSGYGNWQATTYFTSESALGLPAMVGSPAEGALFMVYAVDSL